MCLFPCPCYNPLLGRFLVKWAQAGSWAGFENIPWSSCVSTGPPICNNSWKMNTNVAMAGLDEVCQENTWPNGPQGWEAAPTHLSDPPAIALPPYSMMVHDSWSPTQHAWAHQRHKKLFLKKSCVCVYFCDTEGSKKVEENSLCVQNYI